MGRTLSIVGKDREATFMMDNMPDGLLEALAHDTGHTLSVLHTCEADPALEQIMEMIDLTRGSVERIYVEPLSGFQAVFQSFTSGWNANVGIHGVHPPITVTDLLTQWRADGKDTRRIAGIDLLPEVTDILHSIIAGIREKTAIIAMSPELWECVIRGTYALGWNAANMQGKTIANAN